MAPRLSLRRRLAEPAGLLAGVALIMAEIACASPAAAQTRMRPHVNDPSVIVDYSVLDELGRAPNVPEALRPGIPRPTAGAAAAPGPPRLPPAAAGQGAGRIVLTPPRSRAAPRRLASRPPAPARPITLRPPRPKPATPGAAAGAAPEPRAVAAPSAPTPPARPKLAVRAPPPRPVAPRPPAAAAPSARQPVAPTRAPRPPEPTARDDGQFTEPIDPRIAESAVAPPSVRPAPAAPPARTAARTPAAAPRTAVFGPGRRYSLAFSPGVAKLDADNADVLDEVADGLKDNGRLRLQLLAFAGGPGQSSSQSRRLSLSRALSVRSYLIDKGVGSTRIDVRALGNRSESGRADRVDVVVTER